MADAEEADAAAEDGKPAPDDSLLVAAEDTQPPEGVQAAQHEAALEVEPLGASEVDASLVDETAGAEAQGVSDPPAAAMDEIAPPAESTSAAMVETVPPAVEKPLPEAPETVEDRATAGEPAEEATETQEEPRKLRLEDTVDKALLSELRDAFVMGMYPGDEDHIESSRLLSVLRSLGIGLSPLEYGQLLDAADPNAEGRISWEVYLAFTINLINGRRSPADEEATLVEAFRLADTENTGCVSYRELKRVAKNVEQDEAEKAAFLEAMKPQDDDDDRVRYGDFIRCYVAERKWPPSYLGSGGVLAAV